MCSWSIFICQKLFVGIDVAMCVPVSDAGTSLPVLTAHSTWKSK